MQKFLRFEIVVIVLAAILDVPRFVDVGLAAHGQVVTWSWWPAIHGITTGLFSVVMAASIMLCFMALAKRQNRAAYWVLLVGTVALLVSTGVAVALALMGEHTGVARWVFVVAAVLSPLLVVMNVPLAASLRSDPSRRTVSRTVTVVDEGEPVPAIETERSPALPAGIETDWVRVWNETPAAERSLRRVASGLGVTHTRLRRALVRAGALQEGGNGSH